MTRYNATFTHTFSFYFYLVINVVQFFSFFVAGFRLDFSNCLKGNQLFLEKQQTEKQNTNGIPRTLCLYYYIMIHHFKKLKNLLYQLKSYMTNGMDAGFREYPCFSSLFLIVNCLELWRCKRGWWLCPLFPILFIYFSFLFDN